MRGHVSERGGQRQGVQLKALTVLAHGGLGQQRQPHARGDAADDGVQTTEFVDTRRRHPLLGEQFLNAVPIPAALTERQERRLRQRGAVGHGVQRAVADQHQPLLEHRPQQHVFSDFFAGHESGVQLPGAYRLDQRRGSAGAQVHGQVRPAPAEGG